MYGAGVDFQNDKLGLGAQYNHLDGADIYILSGLYEVTDRTTVFGSVSLVENFEMYSLGATYNRNRFGLSALLNWFDAIDDGMTTLGAHYDITPRITVSGNVLTGPSNFLDYGIYSLGGTFDVTDRVAISGYYASNFRGGSSDGIFGLKLVYEIGGERARVYDRVGALSDASLGPTKALYLGNIFDQVYGPAFTGG